VPAAIYKNERNGTFTYTFSGLTAASFHRVEMHFAETLWTAVAKRKFDVTVNGKLVLDDVDIFAVAGGANKAYVKPVSLKPDATGKITIQFTGVLDKAMVNGITINKYLAVTATDSDGDGVANTSDAFPTDPSEWKDARTEMVLATTPLWAPPSSSNPSIQVGLRPAPSSQTQTSRVARLPAIRPRSLASPPEDPPLSTNPNVTATLPIRLPD